jgi:hypothetical protein
MTRARDLANLIVHEHEAGLTYVKTTGTASAGQTTVTGLTYTAGLVDVYLNGIKLIVGTDVTATNGTSITLATGAAAGDLIQVIAFAGTSELAVQIFTLDGGAAGSTYTSVQTTDGGAAGG